jgi:hypothetical protein
METHTERVRHHLRRPLAGQQGTMMKTTSCTLNEIDPSENNSGVEDNNSLRGISQLPQP